MTPELLTTIVLIALAFIGYKMQKNTLKKFSDREYERKMNEPYINRLNNPKRKELEVPQFEYKAR